jgi:spore germination protein Q
MTYGGYPSGYQPTQATGFPTQYGGQYPTSYSGGGQNPQFGGQFQFPTAGAGMQFPSAAMQNQYNMPQSQGGAAAQVPGMLPIEESYIENILRLNKGKLVDVYATFENNTQWNAQKWTGIIEAAGRDHLILSFPETGGRLLLPMVYLDYVTFREEIEYEYPFAAGGGPSLSQYPPR